MGSSSYRTSRIFWMAGASVVVAAAGVVGCTPDDDNGSGSLITFIGDAGDGHDASLVQDATVADANVLPDGGPDAEAEADASSGGPDASDGSDGSIDAASPEAGSDAGVSPLAGRTGTVLFQQDYLTPTFILKNASASFLQASGYGGAPGATPCTRTTLDDSCIFSTCNGNITATTTASQAGVVTLTGGSGFPAGGIVLSPSAASTYVVTTPASFDYTSVYIRGGDTLTYAAAGSLTAIGPFHLSLTAPSDVTLTAPVFNTISESTTLDRSQDVVVSWTGGEAGTMVQVTPTTLTEATDIQTGVQCTFPAGGGTGTLPSSGLRQLAPASPAAANGQFDVVALTQTTTTAGQAGGSATGSDAWVITGVVMGSSPTRYFVTTD